MQQTAASWQIDAASIKLCRRPDGSLWQLGQGAGGAVFRAVQDGVRQVAVKCSNVNLSSDPLQRRFWQEIELIASCRDRSILMFYGAALYMRGETQHVMLVTEVRLNTIFLQPQDAVT